MKKKKINSQQKGIECDIKVMLPLLILTAAYLYGHGLNLRYEYKDL